MIKEKLIALYEFVLGHLVWPQSLFLLAVRVVWGWGFFETGKGKLMHWDRTVGFFTDLGIPFPSVNAAVASSTEMICGLLLLAGVCSRLVAIPLIFTMCIAYLTAEREALMSLFTSDYDKFFGAAPWPFMFACLIVLLFGPGKIAVDTLLARCCGLKKT